MTTAALIKTGGTIISGLLGGKQKRGPSPTDMIGYQSMADHQAFDDKMTLANKYKIHPLTMLGVNTSGTFTAPVYESRSDNMGQNIASAITKGASDYFTGKAAQEMEDLSLERARLENELLRTQITSVGRSPSTTVGATQAAIPQGAPSDKIPLTIKTWDAKTGAEVEVLNPDAGDAEPIQMYSFLRDSLPDFLKNDSRQVYKNVKAYGKAYFKHRENLQRMQMMKAHKAFKRKPGYQK